MTHMIFISQYGSQSQLINSWGKDLVSSICSLSHLLPSGSILFFRINTFYLNRSSIFFYCISVCIFVFVSQVCHNKTLEIMDFCEQQTSIFFTILEAGSPVKVPAGLISGDNFLPNSLTAPSVSSHSLSSVLYTLLIKGHKSFWVRAPPL